MSLAARIVVFALILTLSGCMNMKLEQVSRSSPEFRFEDYFLGHTKASGWFADRFANVKRHFCGDFYGEPDGDNLVLTEALYYTDGVVENRVWTIRPNDTGFVATSPGLVGEARATARGNALQILYRMKVNVEEGKVWELDMNDWMFYQPDGSLHNSTLVHKWGVRIGSVSTQYLKHQGELLCHPASDSEKKVVGQ